MTELDEFDSQINSELDKFEKEINGLAKKDFQQKQTAIKKCDQMKKAIQTLIESYELEINSSNDRKYTDSLKAITNRYSKLTKELVMKKDQGSGQDSLFDNRSQAKGGEMTSKEMIQLGHQTQDKGMDALKNIMNKVEQGNELADQINLELDRQIEQLDRMYNTVKDTQSILKRTQHLIRYFARQIYTDKLLMCLICLIFIAIVVIIILSATGKSGNLNVPNIV